MLFGLVELVPVEDTFFLSVEKPQNVWLSKEAIELNYKALSPFKEGGMITYQTKGKLFIWFVKYPLPSNKKIFIPEGYLIFKILRNYDEVIGIYYKNNLAVVSVVKNGNLLSQIVFPKNYLDEKLELIKREYSLISPKIIKITYLQSKISLIDILNFANFSLSKEKIIEYFVDNLTIPLFIIFFSITVFNLGLKSYLENLKSKKEVELRILKEKNRDIKELLYKVQEEASFWRKFIRSELKYPNFYLVLNAFLKAVKENEGYVNYFEMNGNHISAWVGTKTGDTTVVNDLLKSKIFESVKIVSSTRDRSKKGYDILNLEITLKEREK